MDCCGAWNCLPLNTCRVVLDPDEEGPTAGTSVKSDDHILTGLRNLRLEFAAARAEDGASGGNREVGAEVTCRDVLMDRECVDSRVCNDLDPVEEDARTNLVDLTSLHCVLQSIEVCRYTGTELGTGCCCRRELAHILRDVIIGDHACLRLADGDGTIAVCRERSSVAAWTAFRNTVSARIDSDGRTTFIAWKGGRTWIVASNTHREVASFCRTAVVVDHVLDDDQLWLDVIVCDRTGCALSKSERDVATALRSAITGPRTGAIARHVAF